MRPLELGADIVVHSATKFLAGHSDVIAGVAVTNDPDIRARLHARRTVHGPILGPMETWLTLRGIRTLAVRVREACRNAELLAHRLADHPAVAAVRHPSLSSDPGHARAAAHMDTFGSIIGIQLGTAERADDVISRLQVWTPGTSLGGVESLIERRRRLRGESVLVPVDFVRLSVGIEDVEDLWSDLTHALA